MTNLGNPRNTVHKLRSILIHPMPMYSHSEIEFIGEMDQNLITFICFYQRTRELTIHSVDLSRVSIRCSSRFIDRPCILPRLLPSEPVP